MKKLHTHYPLAKTEIKGSRDTRNGKGGKRNFFYKKGAKGETIRRTGVDNRRGSAFRSEKPAGPHLVAGRSVRLDQKERKKHAQKRKTSIHRVGGRRLSKKGRCPKEKNTEGAKTRGGKRKAYLGN